MKQDKETILLNNKLEILEVNSLIKLKLVLKRQCI